MKKYRIAVFIIVSLLLFIVFDNLNPIAKEVGKISIQNGNTGEIIEILNKDIFLDELRNVNYKVTGFSLWRMGYTYEIKFENKKKKTYVIINSNNNLKKGVINYSSSEDIINILEKFMVE